MWVANNDDISNLNNVKIYAYSMADRTRVSGKDFNTLNASNMARER